MYKGSRVNVVVPAYNEENLILDTLGGMPDYVDTIFVINDASTDRTLELVRQQQAKDPRIVVIDHKVNEGLGKSLIDGYVASRDSEGDITAVMAGDNQMHADDLPALLDRVINEGYDYVKGNRLLHRHVYTMPRYRFFGNSVLTILTKFATGYYSLMDPQCGYTAIQNSALRRIPIENMTLGYGYNADLLCMLNIQRFRVADVEVRPVYDREISKIKLWQYIPRTSWLLIRLFFRRLWQRYIVLDFHPLVLFFLFAFTSLTCIGLPLAIRFFYMYRRYGEVPRTTMAILIYTLLIAFQSGLFAIWMDMDYNRELYVTGKGSSLTRVSGARH